MRRFLPSISISFAIPALLSAAVEITATDPTSLQRALDASPGKVLFVPAGDYHIHRALQLRTDHGGLWGPGRIIQDDASEDIVNIENVVGVQLRDLTLTRESGAQETHRPGIRIVRSTGVTIADVQVVDNWGDLASIFGAYCTTLTVRDCTIRNYSRIAIDDRTAITYLGYAFNCINGSGVIIRHSNGTQLLGNRILEDRMRPTPELQARYKLGRFVKKNAVRGEQVPAKYWDEEYFPVWRQGAGMQISVGETTDYAQVLGNYVDHPALGIDIHGDHVIVAQNIVHDAFVGMKAMHGSRNVIIQGNQLSAVVFAGIRLMPGSESYAALSAAEASRPDPADFEGQTTWLVRRPGANIDGYSIVANNIISDVGYGDMYWLLGSLAGSAAAFHFELSPEPGKIPPLRGVLIEGNVVHDPGRDGVLVKGRPEFPPPRYKYAVRMGTGPGAAEGLHFHDNLLAPGSAGEANAPLSP